MTISPSTVQQAVVDAHRREWFAVLASTVRVARDLDLAEECVQEAYIAALDAWARDGVPARPGAWLTTVARRRALDVLRRRQTFQSKLHLLVEPEASEMTVPNDRLIHDDQLRLIFMCCHPALAPEARVALTLRAVCGLSTAEIAAAFLVPEATMAKRLVRAKHKIRAAGVPFRVPAGPEVGERLAAVLLVVYVAFTEGHMTAGPSGSGPVRPDVCDAAIALARGLAARLPDEPEVLGLLALLLLTDARRAARVDAAGDVVVLEDQDRTRWDAALIREGEDLLERALRMGRPGAYQLHAAIAACHSGAARAEDTDWRQIALLYGELVRYEPSPVVEANRAVAVAMSEGPDAGLVILDALAHDPRMDRWPRLHVARAELLRRLARTDDAAAAYRRALELEPQGAERAHVARRLADLTG
jgi:RNA polymerase sigma-70 factor (ECF subfamily)